MAVPWFVHRQVVESGRMCPSIVSQASPAVGWVISVKWLLMGASCLYDNYIAQRGVNPCILVLLGGGVVATRIVVATRAVFSIVNLVPRGTQLSASTVMTTVRTTATVQGTPGATSQHAPTSPSLSVSASASPYALPSSLQATFSSTHDDTSTLDRARPWILLSPFPLH
jgi:hypothetical protein